jgi:hypothetical protein
LWIPFILPVFDAQVTRRERLARQVICKYIGQILFKPLMLGLLNSDIRWQFSISIIAFATTRQGQQEDTEK